MKQPHISINTGAITIPVSVDGKNTKSITINPEDALFVKSLHDFYHIAMDKVREWEKLEPQVRKEMEQVELDENDIPVTLSPAMDALTDMNVFMRIELDKIFGDGVAEDIFGTRVFRDPSIYTQLLEGVKEFVAPAREQAVQKYVTQRKRTPRKRAAKKK